MIERERGRENHITQLLVGAFVRNGSNSFPAPHTYINTVYTQGIPGITYPEENPLLVSGPCLTGQVLEDSIGLS